jgi:hypothetical protein
MFRFLINHHQGNCSLCFAKVTVLVSVNLLLHCGQHNEIKTNLSGHFLTHQRIMGMNICVTGVITPYIHSHKTQCRFI